MRIMNLVKGDILFQRKYGFYFVYGLLTLLYIMVLVSLPIQMREKVTSILIYTDPAAMGLFFMGAIVLLEKSQRVINSIAVSPVKVSEYIISKVISLGVIATLVSVLISLSVGSKHIIQVTITTFLGSIIFSLIGLIVAAKTSSLNQFIIATVPFEIICFLPPMFYLFGFKNNLMLLHPGCLVIKLMDGENDFSILPILFLLCWILFIYYIANKIIAKMFRTVGGVKL